MFLIQVFGASVKLTFKKSLTSYFEKWLRCNSVDQAVLRCLRRVLLAYKALLTCGFFAKKRKNRLAEKCKLANMLLNRPVVDLFSRIQARDKEM